MSGLAEFLRWPSTGDLDAHYEGRFRGAAERRLSAALSEVHSHSMEVAGSIVRTAAAIPAENLLRIARAPELEFRLRGAGAVENGRAGLTAFLCEALQAELLLVDTRVGAPKQEGVWSGLGDVHFAAGTGDRQEAPELAPTIRIDFDSPHNRGDIANRFPSYGTLPAEGRAAGVAALGEAFELIAAASSPARQLTAAFTSVVVCIGIPGKHCGSFSSSWYPGRSVLINVELMGVNELAAALVHEAIHSLIDVSELGDRLLCRPVPPGTTVTSPWTGATLSLQSLLDAYFVWYGLLWFWHRAAESGAVDPAAGGLRVREAGQGFEPEFGDVVGDALPMVHEDAVGAIEELRLVVLKDAAGTR